MTKDIGSYPATVAIFYAKKRKRGTNHGKNEMGKTNG